MERARRSWSSFWEVWSVKVHEAPSRDLGGQLGPVLAPARREFQAIPEGDLEETGRCEGKQVACVEGARCRDGRVLGTSACGLGARTVVECTEVVWFPVAGPRRTKDDRLPGTPVCKAGCVRAHLWVCGYTHVGVCAHMCVCACISTCTCAYECACVYLLSVCVRMCAPAEAIEKER